MYFSYLFLFSSGVGVLCVSPGSVFFISIMYFSYFFLFSSGVGVLCVSPGYVQTSLSKNALDADGNPVGVIDANGT